MRKRAGRLFPVLLLTGLSLYYLFRPTGEHAPLLNGVSPSAEWISFHDAPGQRYDEILELPWVTDLLHMLRIKADPGTRFWIRELFPREVLLAREGGMGVDFSPGWVMISRISGRQTRLRLMLDLFGLDGYQRVGKHNGNVLWTRFEDGRTPLTVTLANGKLIFVRHHDPQAIRDVLDRLEGRRHRFAQFRGLPAELIPETASPDHGFWTGNRHLPEFVGVWSDFSDPSAPALRARGGGLQSLFSQGTEDTHRTAARIGGPSTLAMFRLPVLEPWISRPAHLLLVGGAFRSPLGFFNLPTALILQPAETESEALQTAARLMEDATRLTGLPWSAVPTRQGLVFVPEDRILRRMTGQAHRPAARWQNGILLLSSGESLLDALLTRHALPAAEFELRDVPWTATETFLWVSGDRMASDLGGALSLLGLLGRDGFSGTHTARILAGLPAFELWGILDTDGAVLQIRHTPIK